MSVTLLTHPRTTALGSELIKAFSTKHKSAKLIIKTNYIANSRKLPMQTWLQSRSDLSYLSSTLWQFNINSVLFCLFCPWAHLYILCIHYQSKFWKLDQLVFLEFPWLVTLQIVTQGITTTNEHIKKKRREKLKKVLYFCSRRATLQKHSITVMYMMSSVCIYSVESCKDKEESGEFNLWTGSVYILSVTALMSGRWRSAMQTQ